MKWQEILKILKGYEEEYRNGWYSYTFSNGHVDIQRTSEPGYMYELKLYRYGESSRECEVYALETKNGKKFWNTTHRLIRYDDMPDADDYVIADDIFHPYIGMVNIKKLTTIVEDDDIILKNHMFTRAKDINEQRSNFIALNGIKKFIDSNDGGWCGIGANQYNAAEFHFSMEEFFICTDSAICSMNNQRRHFKEREWLFPWMSNGFDRDKCLYIRTNDLTIDADPAALQERKEKITANIKTLLENSGVEEYDLIEITRPFKYFSL